MLVRSRLEYAPVIWNSVTSTDAKKLERIEQKFASVRVYRFPPRAPYDYTSALKNLSLHSISELETSPWSIIFVQVYGGLKSCAFLLENMSHSVSTRNVRDFAKVSVCPSNMRSPYARCATLPTRWVNISIYLQSEPFLSDIFIFFCQKLLLIFKALCHVVLSYYVFCVFPFIFLVCSLLLE
jgi:hypothetical protein